MELGPNVWLLHDTVSKHIFRICLHRIGGTEIDLKPKLRKTVFCEKQSAFPKGWKDYSLKHDGWWG